MGGTQDFVYANGTNYAFLISVSKIRLKEVIELQGSYIPTL